MNNETFLKTAHLFLGLSRIEFERRMKCGQIDPQILKTQIEQNSQEMQREAICEKWMDLHAVDQIDKYSNND